MTRVLLIAALIAGSSTVAAADVPLKLGGYAGLGIGPAATIGSLPSSTIKPDGRSGQVFGGLRFKGAPILSRFSIEASIAIDSFVINNAFAYDTRIIGIAGKYSHPLGAGMDVYGKLGIAHASYDTDSSDRDIDGGQLMLAVGAEYHIPMAVQLSVLVDYTVYTGELEGTQFGTVDANERFWKLGFTVGF